MREYFSIVGLYYEEQGYKLRKYLDIRAINSCAREPELMVVMMNPGGSYPLNGMDNCRCPTDAIPDKTQDQVMKVMVKTGIEYARVLNLSDLRTPKSSELYKFVKSPVANDIAHSIFDDRRIDDFGSVFRTRVPVVYAWGVNRVLRDMARKAMERIGDPSPLGRRKDGNSYAFYHPLPRNHVEQVKWVKEITEMLRDRVTCVYA